MTRLTWQQRQREAIPNGVGITCEFYAERAQHAEIWDTEGNRYIDFAAGIAVNNTGDRHPRIVAAIARQLEKFTHTAFQVAPSHAYIELAEKINAIEIGRASRRERTQT